MTTHGAEQHGIGNTGLKNSGSFNSGDFNSGHWNSGHWNSGHHNSGHWNSGDKNSGHRNSGHWNSGHHNSGNFNSGHKNSGRWNSGDFNSGFFNSVAPETVRVFNHDVPRAQWEAATKPQWIYDVHPCVLVNSADMTDAEKAAHPEYEMTGGYLRTVAYHEAWRRAYEGASPEDVAIVKDWPFFDADVFKEITGLRL